ncbi:MAG: TIM barrel protein [Candidatus Omnitrophota bacterium]
MLALSTAWNASHSADGKTIAREIANLGINNIELNFSLTKKMVEEIFNFCESNNLHVTSLHNFCPIPDGLNRQEALPDCFSLASLNEQERQKAVEYTKISVQTAKRLKAKAVVLHCGRVEMEDKTRYLIDVLRKERVKTKAFEEIAHAFIQERQKKAPPHLEQLLKSLKDLCAYSQDHDCILGLENRFYYREIPVLTEFEVIFNRLKSKNITYWHDVGHAFIFEKLGFLEKEALLKNFGSRLSGIHLHDIKNLNDHQAPLAGEFDFKTLVPYVTKNTIKVIEAHSCASVQDIQKSILYLGGLLP